MKRRILFFLSALLTAAVLVVIFCFSAQPASQSNQVSGSLTARLMHLLPSLTRNCTQGELNHLLRKAAHFTLYFLLGCGLSGMLWAGRKRALPLLAVPLGALCAALDEWHQSFVPGRGPLLRDVVLDTCGVVLFALLAAEKASRRERG